MEKIYETLAAVGDFFTNGLTVFDDVTASFAMIAGIVMIVFGLFVCLFGKRCWGFTYFVSVIVFCATVVGPVALPVVKYVLSLFGAASILDMIPFTAAVLGAVIGLILAFCGKHGFHMTLFSAILLLSIRYLAPVIKTNWEFFKLDEAVLPTELNVYVVLALVAGVIIAYFLTYAIEPATKLIGTAVFGAALAVTGAEYAFGSALEGALGGNYKMIVAIVFIAFVALGLLIQIISAIRNRGGKGYDYED